MIKRIKRSAGLLAPAMLLLALGGCGDDGGNGDSTSGGPPAPVSVAVSGFVEDGPVRDAVVHLYSKAANQVLSACGPQGTARCETRSDRDGHFALELKSDTDLSGLMVVALGGLDRDTGVDYTDLEMRTPLAPFLGRTGGVVLSPVTTLCSGLLDTGLDLAEAQQRVRNWLALPADADLAARPSLDRELLRRSLLLTKIALELKAVRGDNQSFQHLGSRIGPAEAPLLAADATLNDATLSALGLGVEARQRIAALHGRIKDTPENLSAIFRQEEVVQALTDTLVTMLQDAGSFDPKNPSPQFEANVRALADAVIAAAGSEGIPLGGMIPQRIARYIIYTYNLRSLDTFSSDPATFAAALVGPGQQRLQDDPLIAELARSRSLYSIAVPLLGDEVPGDDNQKRLAYYYGSDVSSLYQAEKLVGRVFDDAVNDAVMVKIVEGKADAGLVAEARTIIATQIVQSEARAHAFRALGNALIGFGRMPEAREELLRARDLYIAVIESKGKASAGDTDAFNLYATSASFRKAGDPAAAQQVLDYLAEVATALSSSPNAFARLITGTSEVADDYLDAGDLAAATPLVDTMYGFAQQMPPETSGSITTCKQRVFNLIETAKRYADLGNRAMVLQIFNQIQTVRSVDGYQNLTGAETWPWIHALVETLYRVGETQAALALANSIPASYVNAAGQTRSGLTYQANAFKFVATYEALQGSLDMAFGIVDQYLPKAEDKVEALTYFASNKKIGYVGLALINAGRFADARRALEKAESVLAGMLQSTDQTRYIYLIQRGYVKVADLYFLIGDSVKAEALLQLAKSEADRIVGAKYAVDGLVDIALGYRQLGQDDTAISLLDSAGTKADAAAATLAKPEEVALLYEARVKAYLQLDPQTRPAFVRYIEGYLKQSRLIFDAGTAYTGTAHDDLAGKEVDFLLRAAKYLVSVGEDKAAIDILAEARSVADEIFDNTKRLTKYVDPNPTKPHLVGGYADAQAYDQALALALGLAYTSNRNLAIAYLADLYIRRDDFADTWVASIDTDHDGKPDFFNPLATAAEIAASGLILDEDSDGDGRLDVADPRPLFKDKK